MRADTGTGLAARRLLWAVFSINLAFFVAELAFGWLAGSMGLVADGFDMLADALVYGLALWAVGDREDRKAGVARTSGYLQLTLALLGLAEVVRRAVGVEAPPDFRPMMAVSALALLGNATCLYLLQRLRSDEVHIRATRIFTSNDVVINLGVIAAGALVLVTGSGLPDLVVGTAVFAIVARGALRILRLARSAKRGS